MKNFRCVHRTGFTLVELLAVMAIIAMLAGLVSSAALVARRRSVIAKAKAGIATMETALSMYEVDFGDFPPSGNAELVKALGGPSDDPDWYGPYMQFKRVDTVDGEFLDPWGQPYVYVYPGTQNTYTYDLYSQGPNGTGDGEETDDITNW